MFFSSMLFFLWDIRLDINYHAYLICSMLKDGNLYSMMKKTISYQLPCLYNKLDDIQYAYQSWF